ncbi:MAG: hypothetical protein IJV48_03250 [Ruminococcus sp.]|nr:hypothetical protein [Ruminococcus sp.]
MKHTKKIITALLTLTMIASLVGCSSNQQPIPNADAPNAPAVVDAPADMDDAATTANDSDKFDLSVFQFDSCEPFSEGLAWITWGTASSVINQQGEVIYTVDSKHRGTPFQDGLSCFEYDGHHRIIDKDGNLLYETKNDDDISEEIAGYGNGKFILRRAYHTFDKSKLVLVAIDKNGNDVSPEGEYPYYEYDGRALSPSNPLGNFFYLYDDYYISNGGIYLFNSADGSVVDSTDGSVLDEEMFFNHDQAQFAIRRLSQDANFSQIVDGKVWAADLLAYINYRTKSLEFFGRSKDELSNYKSSGGSSSLMRYSLSEDKFYDFNGAIDMPSLTVTSDATVVDFSDFSDAGYAWLKLEGQDGDQYFTFIDRQGKEQFSPKRISYTYLYTDSYAEYDKDTNTVTVYDYTGAEKASVTSPQISKFTTLRENYFIANNQYFFF